MKVIILGSGTAIPMKDRGSPSLALFVDDHPILFDMGPGTLGRMARLGIGPEKIEKIFLTHFHPDHTADLIHFLFACRNPEIFEKKIPVSGFRPFGSSRIHQSPSIRLPGLAQFPFRNHAD